VSDELVESGEREDGYIQCGHAQCVEAAVLGARSCGEALVREQKILGGRVNIIRVLGTQCDTRPEDAWCAAALATWQALNPDEPLPHYELVEGIWHIRGLN